MRRGGALLAVAFGTVAALALGEAVLRLVGLGHPILYDNRVAYGYRPLPDQSARRLWGARVHIDALGVRGPDVGATRPPGVLRVLFLGDSVTYGGSYVDDDDIFPAVAARALTERLHGRFTAVASLDAGVNAWGPQNILGLLDAFPAAFDSTIWVVTLLDDDFGREKTRIGEVPYFNRAPRSAWEELLVFGAYRVLSAYKDPKPPEDRARIAAQNLDACRTIAARAHAANAILLLVWHPVAPALAGAPEQYRQPIFDLASMSNVPSLDLTAAYRSAPAGTRLYSDGMHLAPAGHVAAGHAIADRLAALLAAPLPD